MRRSALLAVIALILTACGDGEAPSTLAAPVVGSNGLVMCADVPTVSAAAEAYADSPIYVANEMPVDEVRAWAATKPGFEEIWIDRGHNGWITVAFSQDAEARQEELEAEFPDVGVVAVAVDWTMADLLDLQQRIGEALSPEFPVSTWVSVTTGVVGIGLGVLTEERLAAVVELFGAEKICVEGIDAADAPQPGPQPGSGEGWRLLVDEAGVGFPYRTGIAWDGSSLSDLWRTIGLGGELPDVDFETEVAVWFGAVYSGSCPELRLDDVVVDVERGLLHAELVTLDAAGGCDADANPRAYVVAVERSLLPAPPFAIQLSAQDPPPGVPEERTIVDADLRARDSIAEPGEVHGDPSLPKPFVLVPGSIIEPDVDYPFQMGVHCGVRWLGDFNDVTWMAEVPDGDYIPDEWRVIDGLWVDVTLRMTVGPEPMITLTRDGHTVEYRPTSEQAPGCD
jgi:hypothetical protein